MSILRQKYTEDNDYVCSKHFSPDDLDHSSPSGERLREGAVPMLQYAFRSKPRKHKKRKCKKERELLAADERGTMSQRNECLAEDAGKPCSSGITKDTLNPDPTPKAAPPPSPTKETLKSKLATVERKLVDKGVKISKLRQRRSALESHKDTLETMVILLNSRAAYNKDYITTLENMVKEKQSMEGPPSNEWQDMES